MMPLLNGEFGIVKDPELSFSKNGNARLKLRIGAKEKTRDATGNWVDGNQWYGDLVVWGRMAQHLTESVGKGDSIVVTGAKAETYKFTDKEGNEREGTQWVVSDHPAAHSGVGVSVRWKPTKMGEAAKSATETVQEVLGGTEIPF